MVSLVADARARAEKLKKHCQKGRSTKSMSWMWKWDQKPMVTGPNWNPEADCKPVDWAFEDWVLSSKRKESFFDVGAKAPIKTLEERRIQFSKQKALERKKKVFS